MSQPAKKADVRNMRNDMPLTTEWVERHRAQWGKAHVDDCIRRALKGEPGLFYALEGGHVIGTPFPADHAVAEWQEYAVLYGTAFAGFIAEPKEGTDGAH